MFCFLFDPQTSDLTAEDDGFMERWSADPEKHIWIHIEGALSETDQELLREKFKLHPLALQDASRDRHPPKLEVFSDHTFLLFKTLSLNTSNTDFTTIQFAMFVGDRFLVTRTSGPSRSVTLLRKELEEGSFEFELTPDALSARLMRLFVLRYLDILLKLEPLLEELEEGLLEQSNDNVIAEVTGYKSDLKKLRRIFLYHERILNALRNGRHPGFNSERSHELNDVYEQQERASSLTLLYYELASDLIDGYLSLSSHRLNQIMKILTIVTAIFVPLSFLAGIYGMNFENIPELRSPQGYFILLGVMSAIAGTLLLIFRKQKWI